MDSAHTNNTATDDDTLAPFVAPGGELNKLFGDWSRDLWDTLHLHLKPMQEMIIRLIINPTYPYRTSMDNMDFSI